MAIYIDDTIVMRQIQTWCDAVASDVTMLGLGEAPPASLGTAVVARVVSLTLESAHRRTTDDMDIASFDAEIELACSENQTSIFAITSAAAKLRQAIEVKGASVTDHAIDADVTRRRFETAQQVEGGEYLRVCRMTLRGEVRSSSTAAPEDRID